MTPFISALRWGPGMPWMFGLMLAVLWSMWVSADSESHHGTVMRIAAGDKLLVRTRNRTFRVRLAGIRVPGAKQPFATAARNALGRLVRGRKVRLVQVGAVRDGWMPAEVFRDALHINAELVRQGYAWVARDKPGESVLADLEKEARDAQRGLWAAPNPLPPWEREETRSLRGGENAQ